MTMTWWLSELMSLQLTITIMLVIMEELLDNCRDNRKLLKCSFFFVGMILDSHGLLGGFCCSLGLGLVMSMLVTFGRASSICVKYICEQLWMRSKSRQMM